jgi:hypothetical protein
MIGLLLAVIIFNVIAFKTNTKLTGNQIVHNFLLLGDISIMAGGSCGTPQLLILFY